MAKIENWVVYDECDPADENTQEKIKNILDLMRAARPDQTRIETLREFGRARRRCMVDNIELAQKDMPDFYRFTMEWAQKPRKYFQFKGDSRVQKFKIRVKNELSNYPYESDLPF